MVNRSGSCNSDQIFVLPHAESLRAAKNAHDLFDRLRVWHNYVTPGTASGLAGFINGYCDARDLPYGSFGKDMLEYVHRFMGGTGIEWDLVVERSAAHRRSQIPLAYAAADFARKFIYNDPLSCIVSESGRRVWSDVQSRVLGVDALPAPSKVVIGRGNLGWWHLFFFDDCGVRFEEIAGSELETLVRWAEKFLGIDPASWKIEEPGMFNECPAHTVKMASPCP
jgi:hypothetical protein